MEIIQVLVPVIYCTFALWLSWKMLKLSKEMSASADRMIENLPGEDHTKRVAKLKRWHVPKVFYRASWWYQAHERYLRHKGEFERRKRWHLSYKEEK